MEAYQRIVIGEPEVVSESARLTQSLVATEAGFQRSTLNRTRFPELCELLANSKSLKSSKSMHGMFKAKEQAARNLRLKLEQERAANDVLLNQVANMQLELYRLWSELLKADPEYLGKQVVSLPGNSDK